MIRRDVARNVSRTTIYQVEGKFEASCVEPYLPAPAEGCTPA